MDFAIMELELATFGLQLKQMLFDMIHFLVGEYMTTVNHIQQVLRDDPSPEMTFAMCKTFIYVTHAYGQMIGDLMARL